MKKIFCMVAMFLALLTLSISAFADNDNSVIVKAKNSSNKELFEELTQEEIDSLKKEDELVPLTPEEIASLKKEDELVPLTPEEIDSLKKEDELVTLTPEELASLKEEDPDDLLEVCPKCGKIHDGCCEEEAVRKNFEHYVGEDYGYFKFCELKGNALYFVTPENKLMLMNRKTKQLYFIADGVYGLSRFGMNGRYISYVTLKGEFFSVPYEVGEDGNLITDFQMDF